MRVGLGLGVVWGGVRVGVGVLRIGVLLRLLRQVWMWVRLWLVRLLQLVRQWVWLLRVVVGIRVGAGVRVRIWVERMLLPV